jgi:two-component system KDP operon response regulator KdpE
VSAVAHRVLCVDDETAILRTLATNLKARDYIVDLAQTGEEALRRASDHRPDAVILDLGLPGMRGWADAIADALRPVRTSSQ